jgi:hypothetical protein
MNSNLPNRPFGKPMRLMICAALAFAITGLTTQVFISSAGQHEFRIASTRLPPDHTTRDIPGAHDRVARLP